jgi:hypothetical protein
MLKLRLLVLFLSMLFTMLTVAFAFGKQVMHWQWSGSILTAGLCGLLALISCIMVLFLNRRLAVSGL